MLLVSFQLALVIPEDLLNHCYSNFDFRKAMVWETQCRMSVLPMTAEGELFGFLNKHRCTEYFHGNFL